MPLEETSGPSSSNPAMKIEEHVQYWMDSADNLNTAEKLFTVDSRLSMP